MPRPHLPRGRRRFRLTENAGYICVSEVGRTMRFAIALNEVYIAEANSRRCILARTESHISHDCWHGGSPAYTGKVWWTQDKHKPSQQKQTMAPKNIPAHWRKLHRDQPRKPRLHDDIASPHTPHALPGWPSHVSETQNVLAVTSVVRICFFAAS